LAGAALLNLLQTIELHTSRFFYYVSAAVSWPSKAAPVDILTETARVPGAKALHHRHAWGPADEFFGWIAMRSFASECDGIDLYLANIRRYAPYDHSSWVSS
jgi:hypothetical protein